MLGCPGRRPFSGRGPGRTPQATRDDPMKRLTIAGLLALGVVGLAQQQASAWCKFNCSAGFNICFESTGHNCTFNCCHTSNPPPCGYDGGGAGQPAPYDSL